MSALPPLTPANNGTVIRFRPHPGIDAAINARLDKDPTKVPRSFLMQTINDCRAEMGLTGQEPTEDAFRSIALLFEIAKYSKGWVNSSDKDLSLYCYRCVLEGIQRMPLEQHPEHAVTMLKEATDRLDSVSRNDRDKFRLLSEILMVATEKRLAAIEGGRSVAVEETEKAEAGNVVETLENIAKRSDDALATLYLQVAASATRRWRDNVPLADRVRRVSLSLFSIAGAALDFSFSASLKGVCDVFKEIHVPKAPKVNFVERAVLIRNLGREVLKAAQTNFVEASEEFMSEVASASRSARDAAQDSAQAVAQNAVEAQRMAFNALQEHVAPIIAGKLGTDLERLMLISTYARIAEMVDDQEILNALLSTAEELRAQGKAAVSLVTLAYFKKTGLRKPFTYGSKVSSAAKAAMRGIRDRAEARVKEADRKTTEITKRFATKIAKKVADAEAQLREALEDVENVDVERAVNRIASEVFERNHFPRKGRFNRADAAAEREEKTGKTLIGRMSALSPLLPPAPIQDDYNTLLAENTVLQGRVQSDLEAQRLIQQAWDKFESNRRGSLNAAVTSAKAAIKIGNDNEHKNPFTQACAYEILARAKRAEADKAEDDIVRQADDDSSSAWYSGFTGGGKSREEKAAEKARAKKAVELYVEAAKACTKGLEALKKLPGADQDSQEVLDQIEYLEKIRDYCRDGKERLRSEYSLRSN